MNLFTGLTTHQIVSVLLTLALFGFYVTLEAFALLAFYMASRPRHQRVFTAAIWYFLAALVLVMSFVSMVWASPAQKAFVNGDQLFAGDRFGKVIWGLGFTVVALLCMTIGLVVGSRQRRAARDEFLST